MIKMKLSERLSALLSEIREIQNLYAFSQGRIDDLELLQSDLLHKIEFNAKTAQERNKIATQLKKMRTERRKNKEAVELYKELIVFISDNQSQVKRLERILGNIRKIEEMQSNRQYKPRTMTVEEFEKF